MKSQFIEIDVKTNGYAVTLLHMRCCWGKVIDIICSITCETSHDYGCTASHFLPIY